MTAHWLSRMGWWTVLVGVGLLAGCVERRYTVITDPPMATVLENGSRSIGPSPVNRSFDYYGTYRLTLIADGYQTENIDQDIAPPWYEYPPFDFFVENLLPFWIRDIREYKYTLKRQLIVPDEQSRDSAIKLRQQAAPLYQPPPEGPLPKKLVVPPPQ